MFFGVSQGRLERYWEHFNRLAGDNALDPADLLIETGSLWDVLLVQDPLESGVLLAKLELDHPQVDGWTDYDLEDVRLTLRQRLHNVHWLESVEQVGELAPRLLVVYLASLLDRQMSGCLEVDPIRRSPAQIGGRLLALLDQPPDNTTKTLEAIESLDADMHWLESMNPNRMRLYGFDDFGVALLIEQVKERRDLIRAYLESELDGIADRGMAESLQLEFDGLASTSRSEPKYPVRSHHYSQKKELENWKVIDIDAPADSRHESSCLCYTCVSVYPDPVSWVSNPCQERACIICADSVTTRHRRIYRRLLEWGFPDHPTVQDRTNVEKSIFVWGNCWLDRDILWSALGKSADGMLVCVCLAVLNAADTSESGVPFQRWLMCRLKEKKRTYKDCEMLVALIWATAERESQAGEISFEEGSRVEECNRHFKSLRYREGFRT